MNRHTFQAAQAIRFFLLFVILFLLYACRFLKRPGLYLDLGFGYVSIDTIVIGFMVMLGLVG